MSWANEIHNKQRTKKVWGPVTTQVFNYLVKNSNM